MSSHLIEQRWHGILVLSLTLSLAGCPVEDSDGSGNGDDDTGQVDGDFDAPSDSADGDGSGECPLLEEANCGCFQNGSQGILCDAGPPCTTQYDEQGCPYLSCSGSCLDDDTGSDPDVGLDPDVSAEDADAGCPLLEEGTCDCFQNGSQGTLCDAAPPCTTEYDDQGCPYLECSGSCLDPPDAGNDGDADLDADGDASSTFAWDTLIVDEGWGPCPPEEVCSNTWTVQSDGSMAINREGVESVDELTLDDAAALQAILDSASFQAGLSDGFDCDVVMDYGVTLTVVVGVTEYDELVTGCVLDEADTSGARDVYAIITAY